MNSLCRFYLNRSGSCAERYCDPAPLDSLFHDIKAASIQTLAS
jgi:hypothetical protein